MNLPEVEGDQPNLPRVTKLSKLAKAITYDVSTFGDETRAAGFNFENTWQVDHRFAARLQYLGIQDAPRKRRPPSQNPGACAGGLYSSSDRVSTSVAT
jgi:hypothetical protein